MSHKAERLKLYLRQFLANLSDSSFHDPMYGYFSGNDFCGLVRVSTLVPKKFKSWLVFVR